MGQRTSPKDPWLELTFSLDETTQTFERRVQTLSFGISIVGGFLGIVTAFFKITVGLIQEQMFYSSLISKLFFYEDSSENSSKDDKLLKSKSTEMHLET